MTELVTGPGMDCIWDEMSHSGAETITTVRQSKDHLAANSRSLEPWQWTSKAECTLLVPWYSQETSTSRL